MQTQEINQGKASYHRQSEKASQGEQNDANFSFVAPSSEELWVCKDKTPIYEIAVILCGPFTHRWKVL